MDIGEKSYQRQKTKNPLTRAANGSNVHLSTELKLFEINSNVVEC